jgi:hypothetical protein
MKNMQGFGTGTALRIFLPTFAVKKAFDRGVR